MRFTVLLMLTIFATGTIAQSSFSSLEERMTGKEFQSAGLDKLSEEELAALNEWIRQRSLAGYEGTGPVPGGVAAVPAGDRRGFERLRGEPDIEREPIETRIKGSFDGWDGNTVFELENGMIWEQDENDTFFVPDLESPDVVIKPGFLGTWRLQIVGYGPSVRVTRIE